MNKNYFLALALTLIFIVTSFAQSSYANKYTFTQNQSNIGILFNNDGSKIYISNSLSASKYNLNQYDLDVPFDISTLDEDSIITLNTTKNIGYWARFNDDGSEIFILTIDSRDILKYNLSTNYDISTATFSGELEKFNIGTGLDFKFNNDGTKLFVLAYPKILEFSLISPYDVSSAIYLGDGERLSLQNFASSFDFNDDGTKIFSHYPSLHVDEYNLTVAFDVSTATYAGNDEKFNIPNVIYTNDMDFNNNGTRMYLMDTGTDTIFQYDLSTPFDVSTATYNIHLSNESFDINKNSSTIFVDAENRKFLTNLTNTTIEIYNIIGQKIINSDLSNGIYIVILKDKNQYTIHKSKKIIY